MEKISKITVKYFINTRVIPSDYIVGGLNEQGVYDETLIPHPLYIKVTFQRNSTELRSIVHKDYCSLKEITKKDHDLMDIETKMIEETIRKEFKRLGHKFTIKGIRSKSEFYESDLVAFFSDTFLWPDFKAEVLKSKSEYARLLLTWNPQVQASTYYKAALKLLTDVSGITELKDKFSIYEQIFSIFRKMKNETMLIASWKFGKMKEKFVIVGLKAGLSFENVQKLTSTIDSVLEKEE